MKSIWRIKSIVCASTSTPWGPWKTYLLLVRTGYGLLLALFTLGMPARAQINVLTAHNDIARTGQNTNETILTPTNVATKFGKLFSQPTTGAVLAEPLYVANVAIPNKGSHNVVYVASTNAVYAFDADDNGGVNASPLWSTPLPTYPPTSTSDGIQQGVFGTPVIDPPSSSDPSGTIYLVSTYGLDSAENSTFQYQLHALDITTGLEKFNGPVTIQATVPGNGNGSTGGSLPFRNYVQQQRPGLLLLNGVLYIGFGSVGDIGSWHGWIYSYNASTLALIDVFCLSPQGFGAGLWAGGAALAAEVNDPSKPYGRMFIATGNGTYSAPGAPPYPRGKDYSMSVLNLDLTGGKMTVEDLFTPYDYSTLEVQDADIGSGAPVLLPNQALANGTTLQPLVEIAKSGMVYILDRNYLGGYNNVAGANYDNVVQEFQTPEVGSENWGAGVWGTESYWNGNIYYPGQNAGKSHPLTAYSFSKGVMSTQPTSQTAWDFWYPSPTTSVSSNGNNDGILWVLHQDDYVGSPAPQMLQAYDATNLGKLLYSSETNFARDNPGPNSKFSTPMIANGKVYVTSGSGLSIYGLLGTVPTVAAPSISPNGGNFTGSESVQITDSNSNAHIYYTTNGSTPTANSTLYTGPITVTASETITAIASATGYLQSAPIAATFSAQGITANPVLSLASGTYTGTQMLTMSDPTKGATIYYTLDGTTPTTGSNVYTAGIVVSVSETFNAIAVAPGLQPSSVVTAGYVVNTPNTINFPQGFAEAQEGNQVQFNGNTDLDDIRLQLTNGGLFEASSAFYTTPVNIQAFTTDFTFQLSNPDADGMTFTIQNVGAGALGASGGSLGYAGIGHSVAIKFDLHNNAGEGNNSTGLYINGAQPTVPAVNLNPTGINLHSGDAIDAHMTYDGVNLTMTLTDTLTLATWSYSWPINIPATIGSNTAYVGFTGGSGSTSSSQKMLAWTYLAGTPPVPNYPAGFDTKGLALNGAAIAGNALQLTSGGTYQFHSVYYATPVNVDAFTSTFDFQLAQAAADGFTFVIQDSSPQAIGDVGSGGGLGYENIPLSIAIKFDIHNNAGEGNDSTGFYVEGAAPTLPAINLTPSGLILSNGDTFHVVITYAGNNLTWTISDNSQPALGSVTNSVAVNLATILDSNTAYVGFTGASGSTSAIQNILDWTYTVQ